MISTEDPASKRRKIDYRDTITVLVGEDEFKFTIHKDAIIHRSDFFRAACTGDFKEGAEKVVRLPTMDIASFEAYIQWVYSGEIVVEDNEEMATDDGPLFNGLSNLARLYVAGDVLGDTRIRNAVIDSIIKTHADTQVAPGCQSVAVAWNFTPEDSTLRKLIIDFYLYASFDTWFKEVSAQFPRSFLVDLVCGRMANNNAAPTLPSSANKCKYHEHDEFVPQCPSPNASKAKNKQNKR